VITSRMKDLRIELSSNEAFTEFNAYLKKLLTRPSGQISRRSIKDHTWGLINIHSSFAPLVDSRLFQRLRRVRQLELASLVYPSAGYSRFEHVIGCFHTMDHLISAVGKNTRNDARRVTPNDGQRLRLLWAALLHDVGHLPFSHTFECVLSNDLSKIRLADHPFSPVYDIFQSYLHPKDPKIYQIFAIMLALAPTFRQEMSGPSLINNPEADLFWDDVASYLAEIPPSDEDRGFVQMLSGSCDADKIDYMFRDAKMTGIPIALDLSRLLDRCFVYRIKMEDKIPPTRQIHQGTLFLTDQSGANSLEEMAISRFVLYDRVYNHQKARAAETVLEDLLIQGLESDVFSYDLLDNWTLDDDEILYRGQNHPKTRALADRLLFRDLPARAMVYAERLVAEFHFPWSTEDDEKFRVQLQLITYELLSQLDAEFKDPKRRALLLRAIKTRAENLASILRIDSSLPPLSTLTAFARPSSFFGPSDQALVLSAEGSIEELRNYLPIDQWGAMTSLNKRLGYIFCDPQWRELVYIAAEIEIWNKFHSEILTKEEDDAARTEHLVSTEPPRASVSVHIHLSPASATRVKLDTMQLEKTKSELDSLGVFSSTPMLRPLRSGGFDFQHLVRRFETFQGANGWSITEKHLKRFFQQFPVALQGDLYTQLCNMRLLTRKAIIPSIGGKILSVLKTKKIEKARIFALSPNSGQFIKMLVEAESRAKLSPQGASFSHEPFGVKELDDTEAVFFLDDLVCSGSQAATQIQAWSGLEKTKWMDPDEKNISDLALPVAILKSLKRQAHFVFGFAHDDGISTLERTASELEITAAVHAVHPFSDDSDGVPDDELHQYLRSVGESLLIASRKPENYADHSEACRRDALGYGGRCAWVMNMYNAPTICPPALWLPGKVLGAPWMPLFIRRGYQNSVHV